MRALELVILSRHLNLHERLLSLWWPFIEFVQSLRWPYTRVVLSSPVKWIAGPVIGPDLQGQLSVQTYRASYRSRPTGPVIGPHLRGQWSVHVYRTSDRSISSGPVIGLFFRASIGPFLQGQLSVYFFRACYRSNPVSLDIGQFTSSCYMLFLFDSLLSFCDELQKIHLSTSFTYIYMNFI